MIDSDSFKFIGRSSSIINIGGYRVSLKEIEEEINKIKLVKDSNVFSKPNSILGSIIIAEVVTENYTAIEIKSILKRNLKKYQIPTKIKIVSKLNLNGIKKIIKQ